MNSIKAIYSWDDVNLTDLFYAYRKAKADCFRFNDVKCIAQSIVDYEKNLSDNLANLLERLRKGEIDDLLAENIGVPRLVSKKLDVGSTKKSATQTHGYFSDPARAFESLKLSCDLTPEFRLVGDFPVAMHVLSALWINIVGHKLDAVLSTSAYGSRLRRYRNSSDDKCADTYHREAIGSFQPYFSPYKRWRENGLSSIRDELQSGESVIAITMDLASYYHNIDPSFFADEGFYVDIGVKLTQWELQFTRAFSTALCHWAVMAQKWLIQHGNDGKDEDTRGLPIGLAMARVLANVLLYRLDCDINEGLSPIYYGRYIDDMFIVIRDPKTFTGAEGLLAYISGRTQSFPLKAVNGEILLNLPGGIQGKRTRLELKQSKQKIFFLEGQGGLDLLCNIESQIRSVASERRMMPSPKRLEFMASAQVLTATSHPSDEADTLRRADGLAVRRLGWSIQLRAVEILARDLKQGEWTAERGKFYEFAHSHIIRPDKLLEQCDYLPRLLSIAVALMDWQQAYRLVKVSLESVNQLRSLKPDYVIVNGQQVNANIDDIWQDFTATLLDLSADAVMRSIRWSQRDGTIRPLSSKAVQLLSLLTLPSDSEAVAERALAFREADLARTSYKDHLRRDASRERPQVKGELALHDLYLHHKDLKEFLVKSSTSSSAVRRVHPRCVDSTDTSLLPYLFPTRPYSTQEVSLFLPERCVFEDGDVPPEHTWARYVRAVRGIWVFIDELYALVSPSNLTKIPNPERKFARLSGPRRDGAPRLGISSLLTTDMSYAAGADGHPDISCKRYERIERLINQAISAHPKPTHLILPELSLPDRWVETVSSLLRAAGISLVAGLDYLRNPDPTAKEIHSQVVLTLIDNRLGFPATVQIRQPKCLPAPREEEYLIKMLGLEWPKSICAQQGLPKPIYRHGDFSFGVLVCSELQNISYRSAFQGYVDCVMVLSWNQDLETFSALVESASLDVHAHIALVNNRLYGDSRVRIPAKHTYDRDLCRIRGGENEHVVVVELGLAKLRAFQSRATRWPNDKDKYKPVPEGFKIAAYRRVTPS